jgi:hypothetical protein
MLAPLTFEAVDRILAKAIAVGWADYRNLKAVEMTAAAGSIMELTR